MDVLWQSDARQFACATTLHTQSCERATHPAGGVIQKMVTYFDRPHRRAAAAMGWAE